MACRLRRYSHTNQPRYATAVSEQPLYANSMKVVSTSTQQCTQQQQKSPFIKRMRSPSCTSTHSGITTEPASTKIICNPQFAKGTMLFGLGSLKDLHVQDDYKNDSLIDVTGRPFRKSTHAQLKSLKQRIGVWNRNHMPSPKKLPRPQPPKSVTTRSQPVATQKQSRLHTRPQFDHGGYDKLLSCCAEDSELIGSARG